MFQKITFFSLFLTITLFGTVVLSAQPKDSTTSGLNADSSLVMLDSMLNNLSYKTGKVELSGGMVSLNIPKGFKFLDAAQSKSIIVDVWGNPSADGILGMVFLESSSPLDENTWALVVSYDAIGYVKDSDADNIDYDDLLKSMQEETATAANQRVAMGYEPMSLVGWAAKPFYDKSKKVLHWAKEIKFGDAASNTLNYNIRVLGRKGVLELNAVADISQLADVNKHIEPILGMVEFQSGHKYSEFDPGVDQVAAYTIGGLVAGKVLAKVGFFAILAKFGKIIFIAILALGAGIWRFLTGRKKAEPVNNETTAKTEATKTNNEENV